jgi:hypothetical protein
MENITLSITPFIDSATGKVNIFFKIENNRNETVTFKAMTSDVIRFSVVDSDGNQYAEQGMSLQAPHRLRIKPKKIYSACREFDLSEEILARWEEREINADEVVTDPRDCDINNPDMYCIPTIDPSFDRELTVTISLSSGGENLENSETFNPKTLPKMDADEVTKIEDGNEDKAASVSVSGRKPE